MTSQSCQAGVLAEDEGWSGAGWERIEPLDLERGEFRALGVPRIKSLL